MAGKNVLVCKFCGKGSEIEETAGKLHAEENGSGKLITAHHRCMQYASALTQYKSDEFGGFEVDEVEKEIGRGKKLRCSICKSKQKNCRGACCGCAIKSCRKSFHYPCAMSDPSTITKRLVVTTNKNSDSKEKFVYYRVFCSKEHETAFRESLKEELKNSKTKREKQTRRSSEHEEDASQDEIEETDMAVMTVNSSTPHQSTNAASGFGSSLINHISGSDHNESAYLTPPPALESKTLSPGQRLLLSFASNLSRNEAAETRIPSPIKTREHPRESSPWQVLAMPESQGGSVNATVIVHDVSQRDSDELQPILDLAGNEATDIDQLESSLPPPSRSTRSSGKFTASQGVLMENISVEIPDTASERSLRRSPRKNLDQNNHAKVSDDGVESVRSVADSVTPQPSPHILSLNSAQTTRLTRQQAARELTPQNGIEGDLLSDTISEVGSSHDSIPSSTRTTRARKADLRNDSLVSGSLNASHSSGLLEKSISEPPDTRAASETNSLSEVTRQIRKRKLDEAEDSRNVLSSAKSSRSSVNTISESLASVLLIPSSMGDFKRQEQLVMEMVAEAMKFRPSNMCVWQMIMRKSLPSDLLVFFLLELIKELRNDNSETLLNLLFDEEYLAARKNSYLAQAKVLHSLNDEQSQKEVQGAIWGGLKRNVKDLPMARVFHWPDHDLMTLAIDVHQCTDSMRVQAHLQAHKGVCWWKQGTELALLNLSSAAQSLAAQAEVWTWQVWLTKVCPVSKILVLPTDNYLHDEERKAGSPELQAWLQSLKDTATSRSGTGLLLVFQHVDLVVLNFRQYFRKACLHMLQTRTSGSILALVPLDNLHDKSYESVCGLMSDGNNKRNSVQHSVSVRSAFSPQFSLTKLVLLEITTVL